VGIEPGIDGCEPSSRPLSHSGLFTTAMMKEEGISETLFFIPSAILELNYPKRKIHS
jgi:hypothetical protein